MKEMVTPSDACDGSRRLFALSQPPQNRARVDLPGPIPGLTQRQDFPPGAVGRCRSYSRSIPRAKQIALPGSWYILNRTIAVLSCGPLTHCSHLLTFLAWEYR
jgi:hypothetical protein